MAAEAVATFAEHGEVLVHDLYRDGFEPRITLAEVRGGPAGDPLTSRYREELARADLLVAVHPNWWGGPPAILKGWMDRVFTEGSAYAFEKGTDEGDAPVGLLAIRRALIFNTSNTTEEREQNVFGDPLERIWRDCLLTYCGVDEVERRVFRVVATSSPEQRIEWLREVRRMCRDAVSRIARAGMSFE
ncbi:flavodoxin family protein [Archangium violaceum]|nr:flavodoxin family protein [Archangium violaceum]